MICTTFALFALFFLYTRSWQWSETTFGLWSNPFWLYFPPRWKSNHTEQKNQRNFRNNFKQNSAKEIKAVPLTSCFTMSSHPSTGLLVTYSRKGNNSTTLLYLPSMVMLYYCPLPNSKTVCNLQVKIRSLCKWLSCLYLFWGFFVCLFSICSSLSIGRSQILQWKTEGIFQIQSFASSWRFSTYCLFFPNTASHIWVTP